MHKVIAKSDEQLGMALRLAYAFKLPYSVKVVLNDKHKIEFHVTVTADDESFKKFKGQFEIQFAYKGFRR